VDELIGNVYELWICVPLTYKLIVTTQLSRDNYESTESFFSLSFWLVQNPSSPFLVILACPESFFLSTAIWCT